MPEPSRHPTAMPDPMAKWTPVPDWRSVQIERPDWSARPVQGLSLVLVGGRIDLAIAALAPGAEDLGLWQIARGEAQAIRIGRDKALIVTSRAVAVQPGWNPEGWSATAAESAFGVIDIAGPALRDIVSEASAADIDSGSRSAAVLFAGIPCLLTRIAHDTARVIVEAGYTPYLWRWLETRQ